MGVVACSTPSNVLYIRCNFVGVVACSTPSNILYIRCNFVGVVACSTASNLYMHSLSGCPFVCFSVCLFISNKRQNG